MCFLEIWISLFKVPEPALANEGFPPLYAWGVGALRGWRFSALLALHSCSRLRRPFPWHVGFPPLFASGGGEPWDVL